MKKRWKTNISESSIIILTIVMLFLVMLSLGIILSTCTPSSGMVPPETKKPLEVTHKYTVEAMSIGRILTCEYDLSDIHKPKTIISGEHIKNKIIIDENFFIRVFDKGFMVKINNDLFFCQDQPIKQKCYPAKTIKVNKTTN